MTIIDTSGLETSEPIENRRRTMRRVGILGTGIEVPERVLTNDDLERMVETSDEWIRDRTGMHERRLAAADQATSDLAAAAANRALEEAGLDAADVELIIVATATPDTLFPPTACHVQREIGARRAAGFDVTVACTSFINALMTGESLVAGGRFDNALVIGAEKLSSIVDYTDRNTCVLFGDGAGAFVLGAEFGHGIILDHLVGTDGTGADLIQQPAGGSRQPATAETIEQGLHYMHMEGRKVFKFAVNAICSSVERVLARNGLGIDDLDILIPHQANRRIIEASMARLGLDEDRVAINIEKYGNTSSASIPLAAHEAAASGKLARGDLACMVAFGGGLSWGATLLRW